MDLIVKFNTKADKIQGLKVLLTLLLTAEPQLTIEHFLYVHPSIVPI